MSDFEGLNVCLTVLKRGLIKKGILFHKNICLDPLQLTYFV